MAEVPGTQPHPPRSGSERDRRGDRIDVPAGDGTGLPRRYLTVDDEDLGATGADSRDGIHAVVVAPVEGARRVGKQGIIKEGIAWPRHPACRGGRAVELGGVEAKDKVTRIRAGNRDLGLTVERGGVVCRERV